MAKALTPDICVIGAGPGGLAVAMGAAAYGVRVVLVEKATPNGRSLLPHAAFAAAARQAQAMRVDRGFAIAPVEPDVDFKAVLARIGNVAAGETPAYSAERLATLGINLIKAEARFVGRRRLVAGETEIRARRYVLATGSRATVPEIPGLRDIGCLTPDTVFEVGRRPAHLIVAGADAAALELAQAFHRLGSQVTLLADGPLLPDEDPEMVAVVARRLAGEGVTVLQNVKVTAVERRGKTSVRVLTASEAGDGEVDGSHLLVSAGRTPDLESLDLKKARVAAKGGVVDVSAMLRTTNRRIYAIGGAAGAASVQATQHQAGLVLKALLFRLPAKDRAIVPRVVGADPELAHVGLTEAEAARRHRRLTILRWPYAENARARAEHRTEGHIKLVVARNGTLLGVTIAGANAAEMIAVWSLALARGLGLKDMAASIPAHPTTGEIGKSAAVAYLAEKARRPLARGLVRLLQWFG